MTALIRRLFTPPVFAGDEDKTRIAGVLNTLALIMLASTVLYLIALLLFQPQLAGRFYLAAPLLPLLLFALALLRRGYIQSVSLLIVLGVWLVLAISAATSGGVSAPAFSGMTVVVLIAGLLLGRRAALAVASLSLALGLGLVYGQAQGWVPALSEYNTAVTVWLGNAVYFVVAAALLHLATDSIRDALAHARQELAERQRAETRIRRQSAHARGLAEFSQLLAQATPDYPHLLEIITRRTVELIGDAATIELVSTDGHWFELASVFDPDSGFMETYRAMVAAVPHPANEGLFGQVLTTGRPLLLPTTSNEELRALVKAEYFPFLAQLHLQGLVIVPLRAQGRSLGVLAMARHTLDHPYTLDDLTFAQEVADRAALAISNARLQQNLQQELTERKQAEAKLAASEKRFRTLIENSYEGVMLIDAQGSITYYSPGYERITGYVSGERLGRDCLNLVHPEDRERLRNKFLELGQKPGAMYGETYRVQHKGGSWRRIEGLVHNLLNEPSIQAIVVNARDITERKRAEEAAYEAAEKIRVVFDTVEEGITVVNLQSEFVEVNQAALRLRGCTRKEEMLGRHPTEFVAASDHARARAYLQQALETGSSGTFEVKLLRKDGTLFDGELTATLLRDAQGHPAGLVGITRDITERKRAEAQIQLQLQRLTALRTIDAAITASVDLRQILDTFLEQVTTQLCVDAATILLLDIPTQELKFGAGRGFRSYALQHTRLPLGDSFAGQAALEQRTLQITDSAQLATGFARSPSLSSEDFCSYFAVPLIAKGALKGVLELFHRAPFTPDSEWLDFLHTLATQAAIALDSISLFTDVQRSNADLSLAYDRTLEGWSRALDLRDKETEGHTRRVTEMSLRLARRMGLSESELVQLRRGALLHDIGKMGIPDAILHKPAELTETEWAIMRQHPVYAYELLSPIEYLRPALDIPYCHHEKWDGSGYPRGLQGEQIPLAARIFAVVDVWDGLRSERPYRAAWPEARVREHIQALAGTHLDPAIVKEFLQME